MQAYRLTHAKKTTDKSIFHSSSPLKESEEFFEDKNSSTLSHHGIIGQKWGVRRYQNKDGTLTEAGKKRYAKLDEELNYLNPAHRMTATPGETVLNKKKISDMSNEEIEARTVRLKLEAAMANAEYDRKIAVSKLNPKKNEETKKGHDFIKRAAPVVWRDAIAPVVKDTASKYAKNMLEEKFGESYESQMNRLKAEKDMTAYQVEIKRNKERLAGKYPLFDKEPPKKND